MYIHIYMDFPSDSAGKKSTCNAGDPGSNPGLGSSPGEGIGYSLQYSLTSPGGSDGKESACSAGDLGSISGLGRSPGGSHGNPLQYSCLEYPMDSAMAELRPVRHQSGLTHSGSLIVQGD